MQAGTLYAGKLSRMFGKREVRALIKTVAALSVESPVLQIQKRNLARDGIENQPQSDHK